MWKSVILVAILVEYTISASVFPCPETCKCEPDDSTFERTSLKCSSLSFLNKLQVKQISAAVKLNISGAALQKFDLRLKKLKRLESLDASHNKISSLSDLPLLPNLEELNLRKNSIEEITDLPSGLKFIDVSSNNIKHITKEWMSLKKLEKVNLSDNPIHCNCDTLSYYHQLIERQVEFESQVICDSPKRFHGKDINSVNCSMVTEDLLSTMMKDQPADVDDSFGVLDEDEENYNEDQEFISANDNDKIAEGQEDSKSEEEEGSGDEGSGSGPLIVEHPKACYINCSTPSPVGSGDEANAPSLTIKEQQDILFDDLFGNLGGDKEEEEEEKEDEDDDETATTPPVEFPISSKEEPEVKASDKDDNQVEFIPTKEVVSGEMERAVMSGSASGDSSLTYYVLGGLLVVFIALILIVTLRKRTVKNRNMKKKPVQENGHYEEMKPLRSNGKTVEKEPVPPKTPENTPLMTEENGKIRDGDPSQKYVSNDLQRGEPPVENGKSTNENSLQPPQDALRVTIKASEIPDSVAKTPILVHRQLDSHGNYTTTFQSSP